MKELTATFLGHRKINKTDKLKNRLREEIIDLIINEQVKTFLFGSKSEFDALCLDVVTELKEEYGSIKSIVISCNICYTENEIKICKRI